MCGLVNGEFGCCLIALPLLVGWTLFTRSLFKNFEKKRAKQEKVCCDANVTRCTSDGGSVKCEFVILGLVDNCIFADMNFQNGIPGYDLKFIDKDSYV